MTKQTAPKFLEAEEKALWARLTSEFDIADAAGLALLETACVALMRSRHCREAIRRDGELIDGRAHPLLSHELNHSKLALSALKQLGLDVVPSSTPGRPTSQFVKRVY
jgi:phage terminase small subunit